MDILKNKEFYRVSHVKTQQGLWYDVNGGFTGLIHSQMNFCKHNQLAMDYDETIRGYLSATPSLETLFEWFPKNDIIRLQEHNFFIHVFESDDYKFYERFQHFVINQETSKLIKKIIL
jgi:hypothetical protein